jgi:rhodanese-related sulfurtransferase
MAKTFQDFVADAKTRVTEVTVDEVIMRNGACERLIIVDVREEKDFVSGHVPGAIHISRGVLESKAPKDLPDPNAAIVCYCGGGSRSTLAADVLQQMGYTNVASLAGGFQSWAAQREVET